MKKFSTSGTSLMETVASNVRKVMENGIAILTAVEVHLSEKGHQGIKFIFGDADDLENENAGHNEFLSLSSTDRLYKSLMKMRYLSEYSTNPKAQAIFDKLPEAFEVVLEDELDDESAILFKTNNEFDELALEYPNDRLSFVWADNEQNEKVLTRWLVDEAKYQKMLLHAFNAFIDGEYNLTFKVKDTFQRLINIGEAEL